MLDKAAIRTAVSGDFNTRYKADVISELVLQGYTPTEITAVEPYIDNIVAQITPSLDMGLDDYEVSVDKEANGVINNAYSDKIVKEPNANSGSASSAYEVKNAKNSLSFPEPIFAEPKTTSPTDIQDANYSVKEDYPKSYGYIDESKNWYKINKEKNHVELVHASGTLIKIDRDGNVTEHIVGNLKRVINGDYSEEIRGNCDRIVKKNTYTHIGGTHEELIDGTSVSTIVGNLTENRNSNVTSSIKGNKSESVKGNSSESVTGNKTITSADFTMTAKSNVTLTGVSFTINGKITKVLSSGVLLMKGAPLQFSN